MLDRGQMRDFTLFLYTTCMIKLEYVRIAQSGSKSMILGIESHSKMHPL